MEPCCSRTPTQVLQTNNGNLLPLAINKHNIKQKPPQVIPCLGEVLIGFVLFFFIPLLASLRYSMSTIQANAEGIAIQFNGVANYIQALTVNTSFNRALIEAITDVLINVPLIVIFSLFLAVILIK